MSKTCTIIKAGRSDTYGRPLLVGQIYTGPDDEVFSLWQSGFASVDGAPGAFIDAPAIKQQIIAISSIPFLIMPGDGAANGCQFTGTNGAFTLSAAIIANIGASLAGCYAYFSAGFGGSSLPAGWYWTEFSSDTAGIVYAETYGGGQPRRPATKTPITPNLSGWVTGSTSEIVGPSGFVLPADALGNNGSLQVFFGQAGSTAGTKTYRAKIDTTNVLQNGTSTSPVGDTLHTLSCIDSPTEKLLGRVTSTSVTGIGLFGTTYVAINQVSVNTAINQQFSFSLQQSTPLSTPILMRAYAIATYGE